ncbi:unnamed protein product [Lota lota]
MTLWAFLPNQVFGLLSSWPLTTDPQSAGNPASPQLPPAPTEHPRNIRPGPIQARLRLKRLGKDMKPDNCQGF